MQKISTIYLFVPKSVERLSFADAEFCWNGASYHGGFGDEQSFVVKLNFCAV
jgi:hypothetical protein